MVETVTKKELIFIEAAKLFQSKGYAATSIRELADQVGLKPSSFYSHIKGKEEILEIICKKASALFAEGLENVLNNHDKPIKQLEAIIDLHIDVAFGNPSAITVFNDEWRHLSGEALAEFRRSRKSYQDGVIKIIKEAKAKGQVKDLDATIVFNLIIGGSRWLHFISKPSESMVSKIRGQLKQLFFDGMRE